MKIQGRVKIYVADKCAAQRGTGQRTVGRLEHVPWQSRDLLSFLASSAGGPVKSLEHGDPGPATVVSAQRREIE